MIFLVLEIILFPFLPIGIRKESGHLFLQLNNLRMDNGPYCVAVNSEILMDKKVAHPGNVTPRYFLMGFLKG